VFARESIHAFELDYQQVFDEDVSKILPDAVALVHHGKGSLWGSLDPPKGEFSEQSALVDFLQKSSPESVGNLKNCSQHTLGQWIVKSAFISVHQRLIICVLSDGYLSMIFWPLMNADKLG
jgi:hypothetical protein